MYRYIGNKTKLIPNILEKVESMIGTTGTVADPMAGTGLVSLALRKKGYRVIASDIMTYSYHHLMVDLRIGSTPSFQGLVSKGIVKANNSYDNVINYLNNLEGIKGFFFKEYSPDGKPENGAPSRKYFTAQNAMKIDAIRSTINDWKDRQLITPNEESLLKHNLILSVNDVANISGTYGYFLSQFKKSSLRSIHLEKINIKPFNPDGNVVMQGFAEKLSKKINADLCYIDPPYTKRQYAANYHILETIARGDNPKVIGKSGLRDWWDQHSALCTKTAGLESFNEIIQNMKCPKFIISYSEDGLFPLEQLVSNFENVGKVSVDKINYRRFRSNHSKLPTNLHEYLICINKE
ncbi:MULTISPECIES: DNA adenine methylase [Lactobacillus]|uniref:site-specific DNA-methyltransferase (adenine-specific) n=1 Tax=Lactobacillus gasseri TaxID=1596 RepID=A0A8A4UZS2_LACGS|nr:MULTISPECIES: DNA adenine methylase [Lactobacillus]MBW8452235.1 DNA adenine methylase [Lactobacillus paragasseri]MYM18169.1 hypothetical protein [Lactobacillus gasseri]QTD67067.1 DNA adenine methylase [Lactobacillus gasseri]